MLPEFKGQRLLDAGRALAYPGMRFPSPGEEEVEFVMTVFAASSASSA
jgi:hypothetical protein